ncbi:MULTISPECIES: hypothetical protein [unclassified Mesorhizobium]|nr:hypothetical protein X750_29300 [Mesorhizobium sp. LNJC394B00]
MARQQIEAATTLRARLTGLVTTQFAARLAMAETPFERPSFSG